MRSLDTRNRGSSGGLPFGDGLPMRDRLLSYTFPQAIARHTHLAHGSAKSIADRMAEIAGRLTYESAWKYDLVS